MLNKLKAWRIERLRKNFESLSREKQFMVIEYYDDYLQGYWLEQAMDNELFHDQDDIDYFLERAWEMYLEH
jgi:hypothetical protein